MQQLQSLSNKVSSCVQIGSHAEQQYRYRCVCLNALIGDNSNGQRDQLAFEGVLLCVECPSERPVAALVQLICTQKNVFCCVVLQMCQHTEWVKQISIERSNRSSESQRCVRRGGAIESALRVLMCVLFLIGTVFKSSLGRSLRVLRGLCVFTTQT